MQLIRRPTFELPTWSPFDQLFGLRNSLNRLLEQPVWETPRGADFFHTWVPALDVYEDKNFVTVKVELPGLKKEDIEISLNDGVLSIAGERKEQAKDAETFRSERFYGRFQRTVTLPKPVAGDKVKASYKDGILTISAPKTEEAKPRQIEVSAS